MLHLNPRRLSIAMLVVAGLLGGCRPEDEKAIAAINAVNRHFQSCYEQALAQRGTRVFDISIQRALTAMDAAIKRLNMEVIESDRNIGYIKAVGPAPLPLDEWEWRRARKEDLPVMRKIVAEHVGVMGHFINFEPEGLNVLLTITVIEQSDGSDISVTMRFEETTPPIQGYPRRTYPPCEATRLGLEKIWESFEREIVRYQTASS